MSLTLIKLIHTVIWAILVLCIAGIPIAAHFGLFFVSFVFAMMIVGEIVVLMLNRFSCPLTNIAARYTDERAANFDIYLPEWLARNNKSIFGILFLAGTVYAIFCWITFGEVNIRQ